eukprot:gene11404-4571_t
MLANWQCMYHAANFSGDVKCVHGGHNSFYKKGEPACFGLFLYLDFASILYKENEITVYKKMRNICFLDQYYAKEVTGLTSIFISEAMKVQNKPKQKLNIWLNKIIKNYQNLLKLIENKQEIENIKRIQKEFLQMSLIGYSLKNENENFILIYYRERIYDNSQMTPQHSLKAHDPLTMIKLIIFSINYSDGDIIKTFRVLTSSIGDVDTVSFFFGTIVGAYYGIEMETFLCKNQLIEKDLFFIKNYMKSIYHFDHIVASQLFWKISNTD